MIIRIANSEDLDWLADMNRQLIQDEGHSNPMDAPQLKNRMKGWLENEYTAAIFSEGTQKLGYTLWRLDEGYIYIRQSYILRDRRRQSLGTKAVELLIRDFWKGQKLRLDVLVDNERAHSFWRSAGFRDYCITMERQP